MDRLDVRDCYASWKEGNFEPDSSWTGQLPMLLLSPAARATIHNLAFAQVGNVDRALSFAVLARVVASGDEEPCVTYLHSRSEFTAGNTREAIEIAIEAKEAARSRSDDELEADVLAHLAIMYRSMGDTAAAREYEEAGERMSAAPGFCLDEEAYAD